MLEFHASIILRQFTDGWTGRGMRRPGHTCRGKRGRGGSPPADVRSAFAHAGSGRFLLGDAAGAPKGSGPHVATGGVRGRSTHRPAPRRARPRAGSPDRKERGGLARNRTGVQGFAVLCVTTPPRGPSADRLRRRSRARAGRPASGEGSLAEPRPDRQRPRRDRIVRRARTRPRPPEPPRLRAGPLRGPATLAREPPVATARAVIPDSSVGRASDC